MCYSRGVLVFMFVDLRDDSGFAVVLCNPRKLHGRTGALSNFIRIVGTCSLVL